MTIAQSIYSDKFDTNGDGIGDACFCILSGDAAMPTNGFILVGDLVSLVNYLFKGCSIPVCPEQGNCASPLDGNTLVND